MCEKNAVWKFLSCQGTHYSPWTTAKVKNSIISVILAISINEWSWQVWTQTEKNTLKMWNIHLSTAWCCCNTEIQSSGINGWRSTNYTYTMQSFTLIANIFVVSKSTAFLLQPAKKPACLKLIIIAYMFLCANKFDMCHQKTSNNNKIKAPDFIFCL